MSILKFNEMQSHKLDIGEFKPTLNYKVKTIYSVDSEDLENFAKQIYPQIRNYEFMAVGECGRGSFEFNITGKIANKWEKNDYDKIHSHGTITSNRMILQTLCADGHIEPGIYVILCDW